MNEQHIGLKAGDRGSAVGELQRFLARYGYLPVGASEVFDEETAKGLRAYQTFHGLRPSGSLDEATVGVMALPRCGVPDVVPAGQRARFVVSGKRWRTWNIRYGFVNYSADTTQIRINRAISGAFRAWADVTSFTFQRVPSVLPDTEIRIQFAAGVHGDGNNNAFDGVGGTAAHAFYPPDDGLDGGGIAGDVHFDEAETWNADAVVPPGEIDLQSVATHEIGHALGLDHSTERGAVMFPSINPGTPKRTLHQDDIDGIREIYGTQTRVPFVLEMTPAAAAATVRSADLNPVFSGPGGPNAFVFRQSLSAAAIADVGSDVTMQLRSGPIP